MAGASARIETERLVLDPPRQEDFDNLAALWTDPAMLTFLGQPSRPDEIWARLLRYAGHWSLFGFGYWMVRAVESGEFLGEAGLHYQRREGIDGRDPEAGWGLRGLAQGKGYAREALAAILAWSDTNLSSPRVTCLIDPANKVSIRLAERNGFLVVGERQLGGAPILLFERLHGTPAAQAG